MNTMMINETIEITADDKTVWINAPICIGRFCPSSYEVAPKSEDVGSQAQLTMRVLPERQMSAWSNFKSLMKSTHNIEIPDSFCPSWVQEDEDVDSVRF